MKKIEPYILHTETEEIPYTIQYTRRKTVGIAVTADGAVAVRAPYGVIPIHIAAILNRRMRWIQKQRIRAQHIATHIPEPLYTHGATHSYLGQPYTLNIVNTSPQAVAIQGATILIASAGNAEPTHIKAMLDDWYRQQAYAQVRASIERCWAPFAAMGYRQPTLRVKYMKTRWGSLSPKGFVNINIELVKASHACIDYVITHELCHLKYTAHDAHFYRLLATYIPHWKTLRQELNARFRLR